MGSYLFLNITGDGGLQFNYTLKQVIFVVVLDQLKYICELKGPSKQNCIVTKTSCHGLQVPGLKDRSNVKAHDLLYNYLSLSKQY